MEANKNSLTILIGSCLNVTLIGIEALRCDFAANLAICKMHRRKPSQERHCDHDPKVELPAMQ